MKGLVDAFDHFSFAVGLKTLGLDARSRAKVCSMLSMSASVVVAYCFGSRLPNILRLMPFRTKTFFIWIGFRIEAFTQLNRRFLPQTEVHPVSPYRSRRIRDRPGSFRMAFRYQTYSDSCINALVRAPRVVEIRRFEPFCRIAEYRQQNGRSANHAIPSVFRLAPT